MKKAGSTEQGARGEIIYRQAQGGSAEGEKAKRLGQSAKRIAQSENRKEVLP
ncbi:MAG: hypothetical protein ACPL5I_14160 [Thermodesulfobacteriota bacterium]